MKSIIFFFILMTIFQFGSTNGIEDPKCQNFCELSYSPVCATNDEGQARTFSNLCVLNSENCLHNSNFQKTSDGPCP